MMEKSPGPWTANEHIKGSWDVRDKNGKWVVQVLGDHADEDGVPHPLFPSNEQAVANLRFILEAANAEYQDDVQPITEDSSSLESDT